MLAKENSDNRNTMIRLLIVICAIGLVWFVLRRISSHRQVTQRHKTMRHVSTVQCSHCGTYIDKRLATRQGDKYYCKDHGADR